RHQAKDDQLAPWAEVFGPLVEPVVKRQPKLSGCPGQDHPQRPLAGSGADRRRARRGRLRVKVIAQRPAGAGAGGRLQDQLVALERPGGVEELALRAGVAVQRDLRHRPRAIGRGLGARARRRPGAGDKQRQGNRARTSHVPGLRTHCTPAVSPKSSRLLYPSRVGHHDPKLVVLSVTVAVIASYAALDLAARVSVRRERGAWLWLLGGAGVMGPGIWSMHFIGMLAFHLETPVAYDGRINAASWLIAVLASGVALLVVRRPALTRTSLVGGALVMG